MKRKVITLVAGSCLVLSAAGSAQCQSPTPEAAVADAADCSQPDPGCAAEATPAATAGEADLDQALAGLVDRDEFSGVVLVAEDGEPVLKQAYGEASRRFGVPNRVDTRFNLGSIDKVFTKVAIGQLLAAGKISLDATVADYLPDYPRPDVAQKITVRQLIEHRSGLGDIFTDRFAGMAKDTLRAPRDYFAVFADQPLLFEPGESQRYSNAGYIVLGAIIEAVTGEDYHAYVREHVFEPAGMHATGPVAADAEQAGLAVGYTAEGGDGRLRSNAFLIPFSGTPAGGGYATADDLSRFVSALSRHRLLPPAYTEWFFTGEVKETPGWSVPEFMFAGGGPGVHTIVRGGSGPTTVVLSNLDPPAARSALGLVDGAMASLEARQTPAGTRRASTGGGRPPYRLGASLSREGCGEGEMQVGSLVPGSPAERDGLLAGDVIVAINGQPLEADPLPQLDAALASPAPIDFEVKRADETVNVIVTPELAGQGGGTG